MSKNWTLHKEASADHGSRTWLEGEWVTGSQPYVVWRYRAVERSNIERTSRLDSLWSLPRATTEVEQWLFLGKLASSR